MSLVSCATAFCHLTVDWVHFHGSLAAASFLRNNSQTPSIMTTGPDKQPMQALRCRSTDKLAHIPTFVDPKTGDRIVLWSDIQAGFKNVESIWKGTSLVPFLKDEQFEQ